jgi:ubiquinone/menaquinone biosynthesis C-methylase UbiE
VSAIQVAQTLLHSSPDAISLRTKKVAKGSANRGCFLHTAETGDGRRVIFFEKRTALEREIEFSANLAKPYLSDPFPVLPRIHEVVQHGDEASIFMDFVPSVGSDFNRGEIEARALARALARISDVSTEGVRSGANMISPTLVEAFEEIVAELDLLNGAEQRLLRLFEDCVDNAFLLRSELRDRVPLVPAHNDVAIANMAWLEADSGTGFCFVDWGKYSLNFVGSDFHYFELETLLNGPGTGFLDVSYDAYVLHMSELGHKFDAADIRLAALHYTLQRSMGRLLNRPSKKWVEIALELFEKARSQAERGSRNQFAVPSEFQKQDQMRTMQELRVDAEAAVAAKDWVKAAELWQAVVADSETDVVAHARLARALRQIGDYGRADAVLTAGEAIDSNNERLQAERNALSIKLEKTNAKAPGNVYYGSTAITYHERRKDSTRWKAEDRAVARLLATLPEGLSVIDLPFGTGRFTEIYADRAIQITGVDISDEMLSASRKIYGSALDDATLEVGDATALKYADNAFDLVVSVRFLQNIIPFAMVKLALQEMARVTKSWGILEFEVRKADAVDAGLPADTEPLRGLLYQPQIDAMLEEAGFRTREVVPVYDNGASNYCILLCDVISK